MLKLKFQVGKRKKQQGCSAPAFHPTVVLFSGQRHLGDAKSNALHLKFAAFGHEWNVSFQFLGLERSKQKRNFLIDEKGLVWSVGIPILHKVRLVGWLCVTSHISFQVATGCKVWHELSEVVS